MKILITLDVELDGEWTESQKAQFRRFLSQCIPPVICSESIDETDDFAVILNSVGIEIEEEGGENG